MPYATLQDLIDRFGEDELIRTSDLAEPPVGAIDAAVVAGALADADDLIDSYVAKAHTLPLQQIPRRLVKVACDIARYNLHKDMPTETVENNYKDAVAFLRDVARSVVDLDAGGEEPSPTNDVGVATVGSDRTFSAEMLKDY